MYTAKNIEEEIYNLIPFEYKQYIEFLESLETMNRLTENKGLGLKYTNLFYQVKVTCEKENNKLSLYIGKKANKFNLEFTLNIEKYKPMRRCEILENLENNYDFHINDDYFCTRVHSDRNGFLIHLDFTIEPSFENVIKFCKDFYNNKLEEENFYNENTYKI